MLDPMIGSTIGPYEIVDRLGYGAMATVYRARQPSLDRMVAIKVMRAQPSDDAAKAERFRREAQAIARLEHPGILDIYDYGEHDGMLYIVMPLVAGGTLKDRLPGPLPSEFITRVCAQVADALDYAHQHGIVHRDVKPSNILLTEDDRALLADFGIAKMLDAPTLTETGIGVGTPEYLSPEQAYGMPVDGRSDQYSLGMVAFELLSGRAGYQGETPLSVIYKHINDPVPSVRAFNPAVAPAVDKVVQRALAKSPRDRYPSVGDFAAELSRMLGEASGERRAVSGGLAAPRMPLMVASVVAALALLVAVAVFALSRGTVSVAEPALQPTVAPTAGDEELLAAAVVVPAEEPPAELATAPTAEPPPTVVVPTEVSTAVPTEPPPTATTAPAPPVVAPPAATATRIPPTATPLPAPTATAVIPTTAPPTEAPAAAGQLAIRLASVDCTGVAGFVSLDGRPARDYVITATLGRGGVRRTLPELNRDGPAFRINFPTAPQPGTWNLQIVASKEGATPSAPTLTSVRC